MILKSLIFGTLCISLSYSYDPKRSNQWYYNDNERVSLRVEGAWRQDYGGQGVVVGVVDSGISDNYVDDLRGQVLSHYSKTGNSISGSIIGSRGHGTKTAGVISMLKDNNVCGVGIAPQAKLIDIAAFFDGNPTDYQKSVSQTIKLTSRRNNVDIYTNSWGTFDGGMTLEDLVSDMKDNLDRGTEEGRSGKGAIYLWASGNGGQNGDSCSYDGYVNNLNVAAITGMTRSGQKLTTGESCPGIMAAAPSTNGEQTNPWFGDPETIDGIITTDESNGCTDNFAHSSVAPPMAAGVVALALEANSNLRWRDVHHLMAYTSNPCAASSQSSFITNGAGFKVSDTFGFGLLNAEEMVTAAGSWSPVGSRLKCTASKSGSSIRFRSSDIYCQGQDIEFLEHVLVKATASASGYRGRILATLRSPAGTSSRILPGRRQDFLSLGLDNWQVKAVTFWGEPVKEGTWYLDFEGVGSVSNVEIEFYGLARAPSYSGSKQRCPGTSPVTTSPRWTTTRSSSGDCTYVSHRDEQCSVTCGTGVALRYTTCRGSSGSEFVQVSQVACQEQSCGSSATCSYSVLTACAWNPAEQRYTQTALKTCPDGQSVVVTACN